MSTIVFGAPHFLWLVAVPALFSIAWLWRFWRRLSDLHHLRARRSLPVRERFAIGGDLWPWLFLTLALASLAVAAARPRGVTTRISRAGLDIVVLQDGSASMQVDDAAAAARPDAFEPGRDIAPPGSAATRWQRSMTFLRLLGDSLSWNDDRMALTVFAHIATPQVRLTSDPNTVFFFLDHLHGRPPFRLQDDTTWDTNLEQGIAWGLRLLEKDREIHGASPNGKLFILLSDGEAWSGEVARSIERAAREHVPLYVIGVGTLGGGPLPESTNQDGTIEPSPGRSRLDRASLQRIAAAGGGQYFELDRDPDRDIANAIIDAGRRQAPTTIEEGSLEELYWRFLAAAVALAALASLFLRERAELWIQLGAVAATAVVVLRLIVP
ncbi:MAG TPA: vWA domain-containing protein [Vicinamibacterales bacterium]|nr:vWA domain-containing protein [Vicinamibacterales bacterium]